MRNMNNPEENDYNIQKASKTGLFTNYIFKAIPLAFDNSLSYYETLCALLNYLKNTIIPVLNNNADVIAQLQNNINEFQTNVTNEINTFETTTTNDINTFKTYINNTVTELENYMNNYFDNLDVQDEINNKLDQMVIDGVFDNILLNYANVQKIYLTHDALMSDTSLVNGMKVVTLGYHSVNDGGGATYIINNVSDATYYNEQIGESSLYARLIAKEVYPEMFGAYGDNDHNDQIAFQTLIENFNEMHLHKKIYKVTVLHFEKDFIIYGNDATIKDAISGDNLIEMTTESTNKVLKIFNLTVDAPLSNVGIYINQNKLFASYLTVQNAIEKDIHIVKTGSNGLCEVDNIKCKNSAIGIHLQATDCVITNYEGINCITHLKNNGGLTHVNHFHGWNFNPENEDVITGSTLIDTTSSIVANDLYIDTLENGIKLPSDNQYVSVILQNVAYFINRSSYPATQQHPTLLKNVENFTGVCRIDGLYMNDNGWKDSNNIYPTLLDGINLAKISLSNVANFGFELGRYKPYEVNNDIQTSSYTENETTYVSQATRKITLKDYNIHAYIRGTMKTSCANGTEMMNVTFTGQNLEYTDLKTRVIAKFIESGNDTNTLYNLLAYIDNNHVLHVINNSGVNLGAQNHYGAVYVYIDDFNQK